MKAVQKGWPKEVLHIFGSAHDNKMDPIKSIKVRFYQNEGSKRSKTNEKGGQLDQQSR